MGSKATRLFGCAVHCNTLLYEFLIFVKFCVERYCILTKEKMHLI